MDLLIQVSGTVRCVFGEEIDLGQLGRLSIRRGSHVEPTPDGQWTADLAPVQGPLLGPFPTRTAALNAEVTWLQEHWLLPSR
ncbi:MAG: hypothetical protein U0941_22430 [Planctomycetaceae bacterium]